MNSQIDREVLGKIASDVAAMDLRGDKPLAGLMTRRIREQGCYTEAGLEFTLVDGLYGQLYSGFAVLTRDMYRYLQKNHRMDAEVFLNLVNDVHTEEMAIYGDKAFPIYSGIPDQLASLDMAMADKGEPLDLTLLSDDSILHEWHFKPGKRFLVKLSRSFDIRDAVCRAAGPRDFVSKVEKLVKAGAVVKVSEAILAATFSSAVFWYPLVAYTAVYILNQGFDAYCHE